MALQAFFDASGKENDDPVLTVAGYFADDKECEAVENDWGTATGGRVFHLADFGTEYCKLGSMGWTKAERVAFLQRLGGIINRPRVFMASASAEVSQYASFLRVASHAHVFGPAYSGLAQICIHMTERALRAHNLFREKVAYAFEKGEREHELAKTLTEYGKPKGGLRKLRSHRFLPKDTTLLQPADLIAGTVQHVLLRAHAAVRCLDNGRVCTSLHNFERYYSKDGVSAAVLAAYDGIMLRIVANKPLFASLDALTEEMSQRNPAILNKRLKQSRNQGKRARQIRTGS
jgi:hypothetical protein